MKLTLMLLRKKMPNGHIWRGKHRLYKTVTDKDMQQVRNEYAVEDQNMYYLRHPYLTEAQSAGHAKALGKEEQWLARLKDLRTETFKKSVTLEQRLGHLRVKETWD